MDVDEENSAFPGWKLSETKSAVEVAPLKN